MHFKEPEQTDDCDDIVTEIETNLGCSFSYNEERDQPTKALNENVKKSNTDLTAETLKVFSSINIETLGICRRFFCFESLLELIQKRLMIEDFNSRFDLLFNDMSMLKATAVQGLLGDTNNFRFLAWMIFLECIPMDRNTWMASVDQNRAEYETIKESFSCNPRQASKESHDFDHPLSQDETVCLAFGYSLISFWLSLNL